MYETVLVPVDGSEQSERAVDHALEIAEKFESTLHVLHAIDDRGSGRAAEAVSELSRNASERQEMNERRKQAGTELTDGVIERAREATIDAEAVVLRGDPAEVITDYAEQKEIGLIVLGARGRSAVGKFLLGNVAGKVARHATTPVLLVRPDQYSSR
jgi:nucleotide-binding universal stress UspA family protein